MYRCKLSQIILGFLLVIGLSVLAIEFERSTIEEDLANRTNVVLDKAGLNWAKVIYSGRDAQIFGGEGRFPSERKDVLDLVQSVHGVRSAIDKSKPLPIIDPYIWSVSRKKEKIKISKHVPSDIDRKAVLGIANAHFPSFKIVDKMTLASGVNKKNVWLAAVSYGLKCLKLIEKGYIKLVGNNITINGRAINSESYILLTKLIKDELPKGLKISAFSVSPPKAKTYSWSIRIDKGMVQLEGNIPDVKTRERVLEVVQNNFAGVPVVDNLEYASGYPKNWRKIVELLTEQFGRMRNGIISLSGNAVTVFGTVSDEPLRAAIIDVLKNRLPKGVDLINQIRLAEKPQSM